MECRKCNHVIPEESEYCSFCGAPVEVDNLCPECGQVLPEDSSFCPFCGEAITRANDSNRQKNRKQSTSQEREGQSARGKRVLNVVLGLLCVSLLAICLYFAHSSMVQKEQIDNQQQTINNYKSEIAHFDKTIDMAIYYLERAESRIWLLRGTPETESREFLDAFIEYVKDIESKGYYDYSFPSQYQLLMMDMEN